MRIVYLTFLLLSMSACANLQGSIYKRASEYLIVSEGYPVIRSTEWYLVGATDYYSLPIGGVRKERLKKRDQSLNLCIKSLDEAGFPPRKIAIAEVEILNCMKEKGWSIRTNEIVILR